MILYNLQLKNGLLLAPMSGYTNWPMRMLCRRFGAEICYTEMISAAGMVRRTANTKKILVRPADDRPLVAQIFTESPDEASLASRMLEDEGFDGIDINMGCPVKKVVFKGAGAALMKDVDRAASIAEAVRSAVRMPVSVKMRAGWDTSSINAVEIACMLENTGVDCLVLHPRTRSDMYRGTPRWEVLSGIRKSVSLPVVASGDIRCTDDLEQIRVLGADAFMIGRAAVGNPWIFRELSGGPSAGIEERRDVMLQHLDMLCLCFDEGKGVRHMRKFIAAYVKGLHGAAHFRHSACSLDKHQQLQAVIKEFLKT
ncbi:MAG: tRNA dihydrouridine synthase DusB [Deltaproteobacteria bacterium]|nr:tRNA dihydrouridine synthase DusB [Deltaproteobacteria bacterium]